MSDQQRASLCPRLVDYMAIVGAHTTPPMPKGMQSGKAPPVQVSCRQQLPQQTPAQ